MMNIRGTDGVLRTPEEHYDTQGAVEQDPYGAHLAIQIQAAEIADLRAQLAAAEADKLAAMERVRARAIKIAKDCVGVHYGPEVIATTLRDLDLDALAEGEK